MTKKREVIISITSLVTSIFGLIASVVRRKKKPLIEIGKFQIDPGCEMITQEEAKRRYGYEWKQPPTTFIEIEEP